jgi:serine/threonine-protein kinase
MHRPEAGKLYNGRFELIERLGTGGMGEVWLALDRQLEDEPVACKFLHGQYARDPRILSDLKREVLLTRRLRHPAIVAVFTLWEGPNHQFLTMEYVKGLTLAELGRQAAPVSPRDICPWLKQVCDACDYAHSRGIFHRDIKPANIILGVDGTARIVDFGVAQVRNEGRPPSGLLTTSGTIAFMSPEQRQGLEIDGRSDLYSLACTLASLLLRVLPNGDPRTTTEQWHALLAQQEHLSPELVKVLLAATSEDPEQRPDTCRQFWARFAAAAADEGAPAATSGRVDASEGFDAPTVAFELPAGRPDRRRIGDLLLDAGVVTPAALADALAAQGKTGERLGVVLTTRCGLSESVIADALARQTGLPRLSPAIALPDAALVDHVSLHWVIEHGCVPIRRMNGRVLAALIDPLDFHSINQLEVWLACELDIVIATAGEIASLVARLHEGVTSE